jgi:UPF0755 protein
MTDYGRGQGYEPWHSEDPLFGDQWTDPYHPQHGQHQQYPQQTYEQGGWDPYANAQQPQNPYNGDGQYRHPSQQQYDAWGNPVAYGNDNREQYGGEQAQQPSYDLNAGQWQGHDGRDPYQDQYAEAAGQPAGQRADREPSPEAPAADDPDLEAPAADDPDSEAPAADDHPFFANVLGDSDDEDDDRAVRRRGDKGGAVRAGRKPKGGKKRRSGFACLVVVLVLGGGLGGAGWFGYRFYQERFGPAPDYSGQGTGEVQIEIPDGSTLTEMGNILKKYGVIKSVDAFNDAGRKNTNSLKIQGGVYLLRKEMSAASAIRMMLDPKAQSVLIVTEGMRDAQVYQAIDRKLDIADGTTKKVARTQAKKLGLPNWADDNADIEDPLEGFLYPSRYSVAKTTKPADLLRQMVSRASAQYAQADLTAEAKKYGLKTPLQIITVASLVQAEGKTDEDFRKMARVVYNRLKAGNTETNGYLEFDSTYNYIKNQSVIDLSVAELHNFDNPYNTYFVKGLRVISDFDWELQMNQLNRTLAPDIETVYVMASPQVSFVSSSGVKEIAAFGGDVRELVPAAVAKRFAELFPDGKPGAPLSPSE